MATSASWTSQWKNTGGVSGGTGRGGAGPGWQVLPEDSVLGQAYEGLPARLGPPGVYQALWHAVSSQERGGRRHGDDRRPAEGMDTQTPAGQPRGLWKP